MVQFENPQGVAKGSGLWETVGMGKPEPVVTRLIDKRIVSAKCSECDEPLNMPNVVKSAKEQEYELEVVFAKHLKAKHREDCMETRSMRIVQSIGPAPYRAICTNCNQQFRVTSGKTFTVEDATATLQARFDAHECKPMDESQNAARIVKEATENH